MNYNNKLDKIDEKAISWKARKLAEGYGIDIDDARQDLMVRLMELALYQPEIFEQSGAYVLRRAYWDLTKVYSRSNDSRYRQVSREVSALATTREGDTDGETIDNLAYHGGAAFTFAYEDVAHVREIMERLDGRLLECATLLYQGNSRREVAEVMGVSTVSVHKYVKKLRIAFAG